MNFIKSFDSTNILMFFIGFLQFSDIFTESVPNFGIAFWVTFGVILKGLGGATLMAGSTFLEINNRKNIDEKEKHEKKKFYFWIVLMGLIIGFVGLILKIKG